MKKFALALLMFSGAAFAELPPSAYSNMQAKAGDVVTVEVLRVENTPGADANQQQIAVLAQVSDVRRSTDGLKAGDFVTITYTINKHQAGWVGPGEIPLLAEKAETIAYLTKDQDTGNYSPAAGRMSFSDF
jgi:hypothetical protein